MIHAGKSELLFANTVLGVTTTAVGKNQSAKYSGSSLGV